MLCVQSHLRAKKMYLTAADPSNSGSDVTTVVVNCNTQTAEVNVQMKLHMPDDTQVTGFKEYTGVHFDYFKGTEEEFNDYYYDYGNDDKQYLREALLNFPVRRAAPTLIRQPRPIKALPTTVLLTCPMTTRLSTASATITSSSRLWMLGCSSCRAIPPCT